MSASTSTPRRVGASQASSTPRTPRDYVGEVTAELHDATRRTREKNWKAQQKARVQSEEAQRKAEKTARRQREVQVNQEAQQRKHEEDIEQKQKKKMRQSLVATSVAAAAYSGDLLLFDKGTTYPLTTGRHRYSASLSARGQSPASAQHSQISARSAGQPLSPRCSQAADGNAEEGDWHVPGWSEPRRGCSASSSHSDSASGECATRPQTL